MITTDILNKEVSSFVLSDKARMSDYGRPFYDHLSSILKYDLIEPHKRSIKKHFTERNYHGLVQYIFEHTTSVEKSEPAEIDWNLLGDAREILKKKIKSLLGTEGNSDLLKPIISFTVDSYENQLMYNMMHRGTYNNPWDATKEILKSGYLFLASDDRDLLDSLNPKIVKSSDNAYRGNLGIVTKTKNEKVFSGFLIDNRISNQTFIFEYLKSSARGFSHAKSLDKIEIKLQEENRALPRAAITNNILYPLKRAGLIGSSSTGFFYIDNENDLRICYEFHLSKYNGLKRTMDIYEARAHKMGFELGNNGSY